MRFKNWHCYEETHRMISRINSDIMNGELPITQHLSIDVRKTVFEYLYAIGDFDRLPVFDKFKPEGCGVSVTAKRELPKAYLRGLLNIFKFISYCTNNDIEYWFGDWRY